jgi:hypothetical protein
MPLFDRGKSEQKEFVTSRWKLVGPFLLPVQLSLCLLKPTVYKEMPALLALLQNCSRELALLFFPLDIPNNALLSIHINHVRALLLSIRGVRHK